MGCSIEQIIDRVAPCEGSWCSLNEHRGITCFNCRSRRTYRIIAELVVEAAEACARPEMAEGYVALMEWSDSTPDYVRTLVVGNVRGFAGMVRDQIRALVAEPSEKE